MGEEVEFGPLPALELSDRPRRRSRSVERVGTTREEGVEKKMLTEVTHMTRAMKAVRMGLIITSWAFMVLGFMLPHSA